MHIIAGKFKNHILAVPTGNQTRPTSSRLRETLFNICQHAIEGAAFLDLFAGSGAMGLEALSRGAKSSTFVDISQAAHRCIAKNIENLHIQGNATVIISDVLEAMQKLSSKGQKFDIIYADPPYAETGRREGRCTAYSLQILEAIDRLPLLNEHGRLFIEDSLVLTPEQLQCKSLILKSSRRAGRATLYEFNSKEMV